MKILIIHNRYQQMGGEDTVFEQECQLMSETENVQKLTFQNVGGFKGAFQFFFSVWNVFAAKKIKKTIEAFRPDVVHFHNWHYAIGPIGIRTAKKNNVPVIVTIHNYRLLCPSSVLLNKGEIFLNSIHASFPWDAVKKKLYRNSVLQTFWLAFVVWFHKKTGTWKMVDKYVLQTEFAKELFISSSLGASPSRFTVKPNFIKDPGIKHEAKKDFFLFIGRLAKEKGINVLIDAFHNKQKALHIAGDGELKEEVIQASKQNPDINYLGLLSRSDTQQVMAQSKALIFPSIWYEGMPMSIIETFAAGTPIIASNIGAMASMIKHGYNGLHFAVGNSADLKNKIDEFEQMSAEAKQQLSENARKSYEDFYTPEKNREMLLAIYQSVIK